MSMKVWLNLSFLVIFTVIFTQIAFPVGVKVKNINILPADSEKAAEAVKAFADNGAVENQINNPEAMKKYKLVEYEFSVESTSLIPIDVIAVRFEANKKLDDGIFAREIELSPGKISSSSDNSKIYLFVDTQKLTGEELENLAKDSHLTVEWSSIPGWNRVNRVYINQVNR